MKTDDQIVSVIIPFRNRIGMVERAVDSVIKQTYDEWELILVDDCSTEKISSGLINNKKIKIIYNDYNMGPASSREIGLSSAQGHYICFLDSDDAYHPQFLEKSLSQHLLDTNITFTYCTSAWIDKMNQIGDVYKTSDITFNTIMPNLLLNSRPWNTSSLMWNRKYLPKWSEKFRTWEDYLFEFEASLTNNKIEHVNESLCFIFRDENEGLSLLAEKSVGISHRSHVLQIMLNKLQNRDVILRNEIIRRLIKDTVKCINNVELRTTYTRSFLVLRSYSFLGNIFPIRIHYFIFSALLKNNFWRRVCIKLRIW